MKSYFQGKYDSVPATRRSVNKLLMDVQLLKVAAATFLGVTDNSTGVAANGWNAVVTSRTAFTHVSGQADLALSADFYVVAGKVNDAVSVLAGIVNSLYTELFSGETGLSGGDGTVAVAGTIPALEKTVDGTEGATAVAVERREGNNVLTTLRDNLSTVLLAYNRVSSGFNRATLADVGAGTANTGLVLTNLPVAGAAVDATGDALAKAQADAAFGVMVDNVAALAAAIDDLHTWIAAQTA